MDQRQDQDKHQDQHHEQHHEQHPCSPAAAAVSVRNVERGVGEDLEVHHVVDDHRELRGHRRDR